MVLEMLSVVFAMVKEQTKKVAGTLKFQLFPATSIKENFSLDFIVQRYST